MERQSVQPFDSIESTYDFFRVLTEAIAEAKQELAGDIRRDSDSKSSRRLDALQIAYYSAEKLEFHVNRSRRILNDLRSLRRLLFEERAAPKAATLKKVEVPELPAAPVATNLPSHVARPGGSDGGAVAA